MIEIILAGLPEVSQVFGDVDVHKCNLYQRTGNLSPNWLYF